MKNWIKTLFVAFWIFPSLVFAQQDFRLHSHNDYLRNVPFWEAFGAGAASIEVDVILENGQPMVAHERESIESQRTLRSLYLEPIRQAVGLGMIKEFNFHLLIDLKTEAKSTLEVVVNEAKEYESLLYSEKNPDGLKLIISGNRPDAKEYASYPEWVFFDYQSKNLTKDLPWEKIGMVSLSFRQFSVWNGKGRLVEAEKVALEEFIALVHQFQKPVRFWGSPDSKTAWKAFYDLGVDYINTDQPQAAQAYLSALDRNVYTPKNLPQVYTPTFEFDGKDQPVKNILLLIGDGNGLAQISAGLFAAKGQLNLAQLKNMGLVKTQAADDFTTDSAAGATAYATGKKTNNRAIGVSPTGEALPNLTEILEEYHFSSGILTTDQLTGATPAAFYAHHSERDDAVQLAAFLPHSRLDLFIGAGKTHFSPLMEKLQTEGFELVDQMDRIAETTASKVGYFSAETSMPTMENGRGDFLSQGAKAATTFLGRNEQPFLLMIESAMIDSGGHGNSTATIVEEMLDFDQVIGEMLRYADEHPGTLVIITADHETGGVSIPQGDSASGTVELAFHSDDHTGIVVPIFAYGPHSGDFRGIYDNTEVFAKLMELVKKYHARP